MFPFLNKMMLSNDIALNVDEVFGTNLYTGDSAARTLVFPGLKPTGTVLHWNKQRNSSSISHQLFDSVRGLNVLTTNTTNAQGASTQILEITGNGFSVASGSSNINQSSRNHVNWTFQTAPKFFDIQPYTGDGTSNRQIPHNLKIKPGMIVVKRLDSTGSWGVQHISRTASQLLNLNSTAGEGSQPTAWNDTEPTQNDFTLGSAYNVSGATYIAYLFADDSSSNGIIQCGQYTGNGSTTGPVVTLGWEPQWILIKRVNSTGGWLIYDNKRSTANPRSLTLLANTVAIEATITGPDFNSTGFQLRGTNFDLNTSGGIYIYTVIRKGAL